MPLAGVSGSTSTKTMGGSCVGSAGLGGGVPGACAMPLAGVSGSISTKTMGGSSAGSAGTGGGAGGGVWARP